MQDPGRALYYPYQLACRDPSTHEEPREPAFKLYHDRLTEQACPGRLNEQYIDSKLRELEVYILLREDLYWFSIAQIGEPALYCAGDYADDLEFEAARDILANPLLIVVYDRDGNQIYVKPRPMALTAQFHERGKTRDQTIRLLIFGTSLSLRKEALLPSLYNRMKNAGCLS
jgi:hypothetical protein